MGSNLKTPEEYYNNIILTDKYKDISKFGGLTEEQIKASPFCYLYHSTKYESLENIFKYGGIDHRLSIGQKIKMEPGLSGTYQYRSKRLVYKKDKITQYPGVYCRLMSQKELLKYSPINTEYCDIIISLSILKQKNYHINATDQNGAINNLSFSPNNISKYLHLLEWLYDTGKNVLNMPHEVIFHDKINLELIGGIIAYTQEHKIKYETLIYEHNLNIPVYLMTKEYANQLSKFQLINSDIDDMYLNYIEPQYCYTGGTLKEYYITFIPYNPYTEKSLYMYPKNRLEENIYLYNIQLKNCDIDDELINCDIDEELINCYIDDEYIYDAKLLEYKMKKIYFDGISRPKAIEYPPFKYTPEYYDKYTKL